MQRILDGFYFFRRRLATCLVYLSLRLFGLEVRYSDVRDGSYSNRQHRNLELASAQDLDGLLSAAKDGVKDARDRRSSVADKCKTLLTVSSILLTLVGILLPKFSGIEAFWMRFLLFVAVLALLNTVVLLLRFFDVGRETEISLGQEDVALDSQNLKRSILNLHLKCQTDCDNRTDYLVDLYATARFFFLAAFSMIVLLFSVNFFLERPREQAEVVVQRLRSDENLIEVLRGPKGEKGDKGDRGDATVTDIDEIVKRVLIDPRMRSALQDAR